jgi:chaperonin cofactor prefoldin
MKADLKKRLQVIELKYKHIQNQMEENRSRFDGLTPVDICRLVCPSIQFDC